MLQFDISNTTRGSVPRVPFLKIATSLIKKPYSLSLVLCGDAHSQKLNERYRNKTYIPNVLSFPISKEQGEIFINLKKAALEARAYNVSRENRVAHLFIHGILHLGGHAHGRTMDSKEREILRRFGFKHT